MNNLLKRLQVAYLFLISVVVCSQNLAPVAQNDSFSSIKNTVLSISAMGVLLNDSDPEMTPLSVDTTPVFTTLNGLLILGNDGGFSYTPNSNFVGIDTFEYRVCDQSPNGIVSQFDFNTPVLTTATVGPNALSVNPNAIQSGCGIRIPSGQNGGSVGLDVVVPNNAGIFDFRSFRISFTYRDNEGSADIVTGGNFRIFHISGNRIGVRVSVINSISGVTTPLVLNLGNFGGGFNDYTVEYDEVTGNIIYQRNGVITRTEIAPDNSPLDTTLSTNVTIGRFLDNSGRINTSLCNISMEDTSKLCATATVTLRILGGTVITNRRITYRVKR